jgi:outer membrane protein assembly factor BamD
MRVRQRYTYIFGLILLLTTASCSKFNRLQKSDDPMKKYEAALKYYENEKYAKAALLLEDVLPILVGKEEGEKAQFYYAYSYFHQELYIESAYYFQEFFNTYGRSPMAEEALFMHGYSLYLQSPRHNLDQTPTLEAINDLQGFIDRYPASEYKSKATEILDELQYKLAFKAFNNAKLFYNLDRYKAALVMLEEFTNSFPDSEYIEEATYLRVKVAHDLAVNSLPSLQKERFGQAIEYYTEFIDKYPESRWGKEAEELYIASTEAVSRLQ